MIRYYKIHLAIIFTIILFSGSIPFPIAESIAVTLEIPSLYKQLQNGSPDLLCRNVNHVLVIRTNGVTACVTENMAEKKVWNIIYTDSIPKSLDNQIITEIIDVIPENDESITVYDKQYAIKNLQDDFGVPTNLTITNTGNKQVSLSWIAPTSIGGSPIIDYEIKQKKGSGIWTDVSIANGDTVSTEIKSTVKNLDNGYSYKFQVFTTTTKGTETTGSNQVTAIPGTTPGKITNISSNTERTEIAVFWSAPSTDGGFPIIGYVVYYQIKDAASWKQYAVDSSITSKTISSLTNGYAYNIKVVAKNSAGEGIASDIIVKIPTSSSDSDRIKMPDIATSAIPGIPIHLLAASGDRQVTLSWSVPVNDGNSPITDYIIQYNDGNGWETFKDGVSALLTAIVTGLDNNTEYSFKVSAKNISGTGDASSIVTATPTTATPNSPSDLTITPGDSHVSISWNEPNEGESPLVDYKIQYKLSNDTKWTNHQPEKISTATSVIITDLVNNEDYQFRITTKNLKYRGTFTTPISATPTMSSDAPTNLLDITDNKQIHLTWNAPTNTVGYDIVDYIIKQSNDDGATWFTVNAANGDTISNATNVAVSGLANDVSYLFQVFAKNSLGGVTSGSNIVNTTPIYQTTYQKPPNIFVIYLDDASAEMVEVAAELGILPTIKKEIIDDGTFFSNYRNINAICNPARGTFLSGQHSHNTNIERNFDLRNLLFDETATVPVQLKSAGYHTIHVGKYLNHHAALNTTKFFKTTDPLMIPLKHKVLATYVPPGYDFSAISFDRKNGTIEFPDIAAQVPKNRDILGMWHTLVAFGNNVDANATSYGNATISYEPGYKTLKEGDYLVKFIKNATDIDSTKPLYIQYWTRAPHAQHYNVATGSDEDNSIEQIRDGCSSTKSPYKTSIEPYSGDATFPLDVPSSFTLAGYTGNVSVSTDTVIITVAGKSATLSSVIPNHTETVNLFGTHAKVTVSANGTTATIHIDDNSLLGYTDTADFSLNEDSTFYLLGYKTTVTSNSTHITLSADGTTETFSKINAIIGTTINLYGTTPTITVGSDDETVFIKITNQSLLNKTNINRMSNFNEKDMSDKHKLYVGARGILKGQTVDVVSLDSNDVSCLDANRANRIESLVQVDRTVDRVRQILDETGKLDNTIVIFTTDNGFLLGEHRLDAKARHYDAVTKTFMYISDWRTGNDKTIPIQTIEKMSLDNDIAPTIIDYANATPLPHVDGFSLRKIIEDPVADWRERVSTETLERNTRPGFTGIIDQSYSFASLTAVDTSKSKIPFTINPSNVLYDLVNDPYQLENRMYTNGTCSDGSECMKKLYATWLFPLELMYKQCNSSGSNVTHDDFVNFDENNVPIFNCQSLDTFKPTKGLAKKLSTVMQVDNPITIRQWGSTCDMSTITNSTTKCYTATKATLDRTDNGIPGYVERGENWPRGAKYGGDGQFNAPTGMALDSRGNVYVADADNHRVQKFSPDGKFLTKWGSSQCIVDSSKTCQDKFNFPFDIAIDSLDNVYVLDSGNHRVQKFNSTSSYMTEWGSNGSSVIQFHSPSGIAVDSWDNLYVADTQNHRIQKFTSQGIYVDWTPKVSMDGENYTFADPVDVWVDRWDNVYVLENNPNNSNQKHVLIFLGGEYLIKQIPTSYSAQSITFHDDTMSIYVVDALGNKIIQYGWSGGTDVEWGGNSIQSNQFSNPKGIVIDNAGFIYISDTDNNRIQKFCCAE